MKRTSWDEQLESRAQALAEAEAGILLIPADTPWPEAGWTYHATAFAENAPNIQNRHSVGTEGVSAAVAASAYDVQLYAASCGHELGPLLRVQVPSGGVGSLGSIKSEEYIRAVCVRALDSELRPIVNPSVQIIGNSAATPGDYSYPSADGLGATLYLCRARNHKCWVGSAQYQDMEVPLDSDLVEVVLQPAFCVLVKANDRYLSRYGGFQYCNLRFQDPEHMENEAVAGTISRAKPEARIYLKRRCNYEVQYEWVNLEGGPPERGVLGMVQASELEPALDLVFLLH